VHDARNSRAVLQSGCFGPEGVRHATQHSSYCIAPFAVLLLLAAAAPALGQSRIVSTDVIRPSAEAS
jgi:hypothetical protein